jgi:S1-C subfamily serine protease
MGGIWLLVFLVVWSIVRGGKGEPPHDPTYRARAIESQTDLTSEERSTIDVFKSAAPSVCYITTLDRRRVLFSRRIHEYPQGTGSGFVYDDDGHIVTNFHVLAGGDKWVVTLADKSQWEASVVGAEPDRDIAVLKIEAEAERLKPIVLGSSSGLQVGQRVLAIGNPYGLDQTLTVGVVSALDREIESVTGRIIRGVVQTDAAINPGNSGGPLLDSAGRLIGVNTQIASPSGANAGIGFAVPVDIVNSIVPDLIRYGQVRKLILGIELGSPSIPPYLGIDGVLIEKVSPGGGAAQAGLRGMEYDRRGDIVELGDIITSIEDKRIDSHNALKDALEQYQEGAKVTIGFVRNGKVKRAEVELRYNY